MEEVKLRVVIADDEIWICRLIQKLIDWDSLGLTFVQECYDGLSAFDSIEKLNADIVITDIRMPGIDGIELIKRTREAGLDTEFVIISGYRDFEYAQKALQYNVYDYILKPINEDLLIEALCDLKKTILTNRSQKAYEVELTEKANHYEQIVLERALFSCLNGIPCDYSPIYEALALDSVDPAYRLFYVLIVNLMPLSLASNNYERNTAVKASLKGNILECLNVRQNYSFYLEKDDQMIFILHSDQFLKEEIRHLSRKIRSTILDDTDISKYYCFTAGLGGPVNAFEEINFSYEQADEAWRTFLHFGSNKIYDHENNKFQAVDIDGLFDFERSQELSGIWIRNDELELTRFIRNLFVVLQNSNITPMAYYQTSEVLLKFIDEKFHCQIDTKNTTWDVNTLVMQLQRCTGKSQIVNFLILTCSEAMERWHKRIVSKKSGYIMLAIEYIQQNYMNNITLKEVAAHVFMNPTYFSEMFKKEMGINFKKYLIEYRVQIAAELLKKTQHKITDIAFMVGYRDGRYFSRLFCKVMGMSAQQYRKTFE